MPDHMRIVVTFRGSMTQPERSDYTARVEGMPGRWGCGSSALAAIGDLVATHKEVFGIAAIEHPYAQSRGVEADA